MLVGISPDFARIAGGMIKSTSTRLWFAATSIPPIRPENLLPVVMMLILWIVMRQTGFSEERAFVSSVVLAEVYTIWRNLPNAAYSLRKVREGKPGMLRWPVLIMVLLAGVQLALNDPLVTQRILLVHGFDGAAHGRAIGRRGGLGKGRRFRPCHGQDARCKSPQARPVRIGLIGQGGAQFADRPVVGVAQKITVKRKYSGSQIGGPVTDARFGGGDRKPCP